MSDPWFKFYPSDWRSDPKLRLVSLPARGLWMEMLCIMHEADQRGDLTVGGVTIDAPKLARMVGETVETVEALLKELQDADVFSTRKNGVIFSRRMEKDENKRRKMRENGKKGGNPNLRKQTENEALDNQPVKTTDTRSQKPDTRDNKKPSGKKMVSLPEGFPDLKAKEAAKSYWREQGRLDLCDRVDRIATAFEAHHAAKGSTFADWRRAWQTWYVNQVDMTKPPPSAPAPTKATSKRDEERYRLERLRDDGMWIDTLWGIKPFLPDGSFNEMYAKEGGSQALVEQVFGRRELPLEKAS